MVFMQDKSFRIIEYEDKYSNQIVEFIKEIAIKEYKYLDWEDYFRRMEFSEYKNNDESKFWIALNNKNQIVGTIGALKITNEEIKMNSLYVRKDYRQLGIAKELYRLVGEFAKNKNYKVITLRTFFKFITAISFYEKNGFIKYKQDEESYSYKKEINKEII